MGTPTHRVPTHQVSARLRALALGCALAFLLAEGLLRALAWRAGAELGSLEKPSIYRPHPYLVWELAPNTQKGTGERVSRTGLRGLDRPTVKPAGVFRIACLGGSTTFGTSLGEKETYPAQLEDWLRAMRPDKNVEVLNFGVPGYTGTETFFQLMLKVLDHEPDLLVVYHGANDLTAEHLASSPLELRRVWTEEECEWSTPQRLLRKSFFVEFLQDSLVVPPGRSALSYWTQRNRGLAGPASRPESRPGFAEASAWERALAGVHSIATYRGIAVLLVPHTYRPLSQAWQEDMEAMNDRTRRFAQAHQVPMVDISRTFPSAASFFGDDPVHHNSEGAARFAELLAKACVEKKLLERPAPAEPARFRVPDRVNDPIVDAAPECVETEALRSGAAVEPLPFLLYGPRQGPAAGTLGPHNSLGGRGPLPAAEKAAPRIVVLGGSAAYGLLCTEPESFPRRLEAELRNRGIAGAKVVNLAFPGYTTTESLAAWHLRAGSLRPDMVILAHDLEDSLPILTPGFRTDGSHMRKPFEVGEQFPWDRVPPRAGLDPSRCGVPLRAVRSAQRPLPDEPTITEPSRLALGRNLRSLCDLIRGTGAVPVLLHTGAAQGASAGVHLAVARWNETAALVAAISSAPLLNTGRATTRDLDFHPGGWLPRTAAHAARASLAAEELARHPALSRGR